MPKRSSLAPYIWLLPGVLGIAVFNYFPSICSLILSFTQWNLLSHPEWIGLDNYSQLLASSRFWQNLGTTLVFVFWTMTLELGLGFFLAMGFYKLSQQWTWLKAAYVLPFITPMVSLSVVWGWFYEPQGGLLNQLASAWGLPSIAWLYEPKTALAAIIVFRLWKQVGYTMLLLSAGLESLPTELMEAAHLDGASGLTLVTKIVLPIMAPVLCVVGVTVLINAFQAFDVIYLLTQGGPNHSTEVLVYQLFKQAFEQYQIGSASALAYILCGLIMGLTLWQAKLRSRLSTD